MHGSFPPYPRAIQAVRIVIGVVILAAVVAASFHWWWLPIWRLIYPEG